MNRKLPSNEEILLKSCIKTCNPHLLITGDKAEEIVRSTPLSLPELYQIADTALDWDGSALLKLIESIGVHGGNVEPLRGEVTFHTVRKYVVNAYDVITSMARDSGIPQSVDFDDWQLMSEKVEAYKKTIPDDYTLYLPNISERDMELESWSMATPVSLFRVCRPDDVRLEIWYLYMRPRANTLKEAPKTNNNE